MTGYLFGFGSRGYLSFLFFGFGTSPVWRSFIAVLMVLCVPRFDYVFYLLFYLLLAFLLGRGVCL